MTKLCDKIRKARKEKGWTIKKLSVRTGISQAYLCELETGACKNPTLEKMVRISKILGISLNSLANEEMEINQQKLSKQGIMKEFDQLIAKLREWVEGEIK